MPLLVLTEAQAQAAMEAADSDLKYLLSEVGVADEVQVALYHRGYTSLRLFSGIDETRAEVRGALNDEIGLDHTAGNVEEAQHRPGPQCLGDSKDTTEVQR